MRKLALEKEKLLKETITQFPVYTDVKIAKQLKVNKVTVAKYRKEIDLHHDVEFISIVAGKFIAAYGKASDYWYAQITELQELKKSQKTIFRKNKDGSMRPELVDQEPSDILAICKQQAELQKMVLFLAAQGEVKEVIKLMRNGKLPIPT